MGMGVVDALLLLVPVGLLFLVLVGFLRFSGKKELGLTVELARVATRAAQETSLSNFNDDCVGKLMLETAEPDSKLGALLDTIELDENLQFLRFSEGYCGRPTRRVIKYRCLLATESESFYRCRLVSSRGDPPQSQSPRASVKDQWLYTVIQPQPQQQKPDMVRIHSNIVPRQAYLKRLNGMIATCCEPRSCTRGFSRISALREGEPYYTSCTNCVLGEELKRGAAHVDAELATLWQLAQTDVKLVEDHPDIIAEGRDGRVQKVHWRTGVFAKKQFFFKGPVSDREIEIATEVSHPNIVHCFGVSPEWSPVDQSVSLYMELLEESLETRIQEPIQQECRFSFQDIVSVLWQVADAMRELHGKRFIHGDLKPGNILLSRLGMPHSQSGTFFLVKVADFGCAQRVPPEGFADPESADGKSNERVYFCSSGGTTNYTAPEVFRHRLDKRPPKHPEKIDVYSFGVVAYQMLTGVSYFNLYDGATPSKLKAGVEDGSLKPSTKYDFAKLGSDHISLYDSLVVKCWHANPESRPSFSDICDVLETLPSKHEENVAHWCMGFLSAVMTSLRARIRNYT